MIIDLYQSPIQGENAVEQAVSNFYFPLIKLIKANKDVNISLNIPLSTLELLDKFGHMDLISEIKDLYEKERVEIVGYSAYNSLLTKFPKEIVEGQIILNEYGLGYYLGSRQGFEGESSIMIKDLIGFVPPALDINDTVLDVLEEMGYKWVAVKGRLDENQNHGLSSRSNFHRLEDRELIAVEIIDVLSLFFENEKDEGTNVQKFENFQYRKEKFFKKLDELVIDGFRGSAQSFELEDQKVFRLGDRLVRESDANFYKRNLESIEMFLEYFKMKGFRICSVNDLLKNMLKDDSNLEYVSLKNISGSDVSMIYYDKKDEKTNRLKIIEADMCSLFSESDYIAKSSDLISINMWNDDEIGEIEDSKLRNNICKFILFSKYICMDKYFYLNEINDSIDGKNIFLDKLRSFVYFARGFIKCAPDTSSSNKLSKDVEDLLGVLSR